MRRIEQDNGLPTQTEFALVSFTIGTFSYAYLTGTAYTGNEATAVESWETNTENLMTFSIIGIITRTAANLIFLEKKLIRVPSIYDL